MPKFKNSNATFWVIFKQCEIVKNWTLPISRRWRSPLCLSFTNFASKQIIVLHGPFFHDVSFIGLRITLGVNMSFTGSTLHHFLLSRMSISSSADGTSQAFISLLVARIANSVIGMPTWGLSGAWSSRSTISTLAAQLQITKQFLLSCLIKTLDTVMSNLVKKFEYFFGLKKGLKILY